MRCLSFYGGLQIHFQRAHCERRHSMDVSREWGHLHPFFMKPYGWVMSWTTHWSIQISFGILESRRRIIRTPESRCTSRLNQTTCTFHFALKERPYTWTLVHLQIANFMNVNTFKCPPKHHGILTSSNFLNLHVARRRKHVRMVGSQRSRQCKMTTAIAKKQHVIALLTWYARARKE
jgi:hypothetical protein